MAKYKQIIQNLKDSISNGRYRHGDRLPSEAELVKMFETSRITVNRALRELQILGLIERKAGSGSYVREVARQSHTFGLLIPDLGRTEIFEPICQGMAQAREPEQYSLIWGKALDDSATKALQATEISRQFIRERVSGVFFAPLELTPEKDSVNRKICKEFDEAGIPVVLLDRDLVAYPDRSPYDLVGIDNRRAGYLITRQLLESGCKRLAFIGRPRSAPTVDARIAGFREALLDSPLGFRPNLVCRVEPWDVDAVRKALEAIDPDGIVCANDFTAGNLMKSLGELNFVVPDRVRLVGIDDVKYASLLSVPLTTIHQPCDEIGKAAVAAMMERLRNPSLPARDILLNFRLVVRQSCGARVSTSKAPEAGSYKQ